MNCHFLTQFHFDPTVELVFTITERMTEIRNLLSIDGLVARLNI